MTVQPREERNRDRIKSALGVALFHALLGYALITGLGFNVTRVAGDTLKLFDVSAPPPPLPPEALVPEQARAKDPEGAAAPPNLKATPVPVVAPEPEVRLDVPPLIAVAPIAAAAFDLSAGAAPLPGPGTGAGGEGSGLGSGGAGSGTGGGGGIVTRARQIAGRIRDSDYPRAASKARAQGQVVARFTIGTDGVARDCAVLESSGNAALDDTTCRLIESRFRFEPARDAEGRPVPEVSGWEQMWWLERRR